LKGTKIKDLRPQQERRTGGRLTLKKSEKMATRRGAAEKTTSQIKKEV